MYKESTVNAQIEAVFNAALSLPPHNRAALAEKLLDSLGEKEQKEIDEAWTKEAEDRLQAFEEGRITAVPLQEVMRSVRQGNKP
jgi:putative addiction module component (TIGR02574 family)